jgi:glucokinase
MTKRRLVVDIGGTRIRAAVVSSSAPLVIGEVHEGASKTQGDVLGVITSCLHQAGAPRPADGIFALAGPIVGDPVRITNLRWLFSVDEMRKALGLSEIAVINDFVAVAMSIPYLARDMRIAVSAGSPDKQGNIAVVGAGTGLGVACLVPTRGGGVVIPGEGGHVTLSPSNGRESRVFEWLSDDHLRSDGEKWNGHVSAERVLSGPGLINLYKSVLHLDDGEHHNIPQKPEWITSKALRDFDRKGSVESPELKTVELFCSMLAGFAGNVALTFGATGGLFLAGGISNSLVPFISDPSFRQRFSAKGRLSSYLARVPLSVISYRYPALIGLAHLEAHENSHFPLKPVRVHALRSPSGTTTAGN